MPRYGGWPTGFYLDASYLSFVPKRRGAKPRKKWEKALKKHQAILNDDNMPKRKVKISSKWVDYYKRLLALPIPKRGRPKGVTNKKRKSKTGKRKSSSLTPKKVKRKKLSLTPKTKKGTKRRFSDVSDAPTIYSDDEIFTEEDINNPNI